MYLLHVNGYELKFVEAPERSPSFQGGFVIGTHTGANVSNIFLLATKSSGPVATFYIFFLKLSC